MLESPKPFKKNNEIGYSLGEIGLMVKRAARAEGYHWGHCEEAARAVMFLCSLGLDGTSSFLQLLQLRLAHNIEQHSPLSLEGVWRGKDGLCPLITASTICDHVELLRYSSINIEKMVAPLMMTYMMACIANKLNSHVTVECDDGVVVIGKDKISTIRSQTALSMRVKISLGGSIHETMQHNERAYIQKDSYAYLQKIAARTYAPSGLISSRLSGAGAGLTDND